MSTAYFVHELSDAAVARRVQVLRLAGREVVLLGFDRVRDAEQSPPPEGIVLGRTRNGRFIQRAGAVLMAIPRALARQRLWRNADLVIARNLEMLVLASVLLTLTGARARLVYECLDIHRLAVGKGAVSRFLRALERLCLRRAALVLTSSPAFEHCYFRGLLGYRGRVLVAENKVLDAPPEAARQAAPRPPWVIAWCGVLRCRRSFNLLEALAAAMPDRVRIELWGRPALDQLPHFFSRLGASPAMRYCGPYAQADLAAIYGRAHFAWAIDFYEAGSNSDWLLPNRLYESLCFGATPIAADGVESGRWAKSRGVGVVLDAPLERSLPAFFAGLEASGYAALRDAAGRLDPDAVRLTPQGVRDFDAQLAGAV